VRHALNCITKLAKKLAGKLSEKLAEKLIDHFEQPCFLLCIVMIHCFALV